VLLLLLLWGRGRGEGLSCVVGGRRQSARVGGGSAAWFAGAVLLTAQHLTARLELRALLHWHRHNSCQGCALPTKGRRRVETKASQITFSPALTAARQLSHTRCQF